MLWLNFLADKNPGVQYNQQIEQQVNSPVTTGMSGDERDIHFEEAGKFIIEKEKASIGMLQRMFKNLVSTERQESWISSATQV